MVNFHSDCRNPLTDHQLITYDDHDELMKLTTAENLGTTNTSQRKKTVRLQSPNNEFGQETQLFKYHTTLLWLNY